MNPCLFLRWTVRSGGRPGGGSGGGPGAKEYNHLGSRGLLSQCVVGGRSEVGCSLPMSNRDIPAQRLPRPTPPSSAAAIPCCHCAVISGGEGCVCQVESLGGDSVGFNSRLCLSSTDIQPESLTNTKVFSQKPWPLTRVVPAATLPCCLLAVPCGWASLGGVCGGYLEVVVEAGG